MLRASTEPPAINLADPDSGRISEVWRQAVSEYISTVELSKKDSEWLSHAKSSSDIVAVAVQTQSTENENASRSERFSQKMFLSAVLSAGTHNEMVKTVEVIGGNVPPVVSNQIATFLRYASSIDAFLNAMGNTTFASAFVFGAIRVMLDIAVNNVKLLVSIGEKFAEVDMRLRRLDVYLALKEPSEAVRLMTLRVLVNTLRFCGIATKYFSKKGFWRSIRLKNQMEAVIADLDKDMTIEIASGVSHLNFTIERMRDDSVLSKCILPTWGKIMPHQRNPHFTGRDELLDELYVRLCETKPKQYSHRIALYGLGGVGKTQTAIEYAYRNEKLYDGIYWVSAVDEAALLSGFQEIADLTKCVTGAKDLKPTDVAKRVLLWLHQQENWLMIFDNLDDVAILKDYLPDMISGGHTLITTRNPKALSIPAEGLEVRLLDQHSASELLCMRSGVVIDPIAEAEAVKIVTELGFLPLAIEQAAAYIREASNDIFTFLQMYKLHRKELHKRMPSGNWDYESSVATTWQLAFGVIENENPHAAKLLQLFAFLNPDLILIEFLQAGVEGLFDDLRELVLCQLDFQEALFVLERFSLIKRTHDGIIIHRLVQTVIKDNLTESDICCLWNATIGLCHAAFPEPNLESHVRCRRLQDQVSTLLYAPATENSIQLGEILDRVGLFLQEDGKYKEAQDFHSKAVLIFSAVLEKNNPVFLTAMHNIQRTCHYNGKFEEAVKVGEDNMKTRIAVLGVEHLDTLASMDCLACTYQGQGRLGDAQKLLEQCLELKLQVLGQKHPDTLVSMKNLAWTYQSQGRLVDAQRLQERCFEIQVEVLGENNPMTLKSQSNLALMYRNQCRLKEAQNLQEKALKTYLQRLGTEHYCTLNEMTNLAITYRLQGQMLEAEELEGKSLEAKRRNLGEEHRFTMESVMNLAAIYSELGRVDEAIEMEKKNLEMKKRVLGVNNPHTRDSEKNLEEIYRKKDQSLDFAKVDGLGTEEAGTSSDYYYSH